MEINNQMKILAVKEYFNFYRDKATYIHDSLEPPLDAIEEAETLKQKLLLLTAELENKEGRAVIERKYIQLQSNRTVCKALCISESHRRNLHNRGMLKLYNILEKRHEI